MSGDQRRIPEFDYTRCPRQGCAGVLDYDGLCTAEFNIDLSAGLLSQRVEPHDMGEGVVIPCDGANCYVCAKQGRWLRG